eukprot:Em0006g1260a
MSSKFEVVVLFSSFVVALGSRLEDFKSIYPSVKNGNDTRIPLTLGLMVSFSGDYVTSSSIASVQIALDLINENSSLLPGYRLQYKLTDSQCNQTVAYDSFFLKYVREQPNIVGLVGSGCEDATIAVASISHYFNITQVSPDSAAPVLEDRTKYRRYFQMLPSESSLPIVYKVLCTMFGWRKLHTITAENDVFNKVLDVTRGLLKGVAEITSVIYNDANPQNSIDYYIHNERLFDEDTRIIELAMYESDARKAYHKSKISPKYVLILRTWYPSGWWDPANELNYILNCTKRQMENALNGALSVSLDTFYNAEDSLSGLTFSQYWDWYTQLGDKLGLNYNHSDPTFFDAVWAYAIALNKTIQDLNEQTCGTTSFMSNNSCQTSIENFAYSNSAFVERMFKHLSNTSFTGITGNVSFTTNGIRSSYAIGVSQYRFNKAGILEIVPIGYVTQTGEMIFNETESSETIFPYGIPPDGTTFTVEKEIEKPLTIIMYILAILGMILVSVCIGFTAIFHKTRLVRLTSPALTMITCSGCCLLYICIFFAAIQSKAILPTSVICNVRIWLWSIGYSLAFGPILVKTCRIYYIFNDPRPNKLAVKDWMLVAIVCILVAIDVVLMILTLSVPQLRVGAVLVHDLVNPKSETGFFEEETMNMILVCESTPKKSFQIWRIILIAYKAILQASAIPLAFAIRKVKTKGLNDSKYLVAIVFITSISLAVIIVCYAAIYDHVNTSAAIYSIGAWITSTTILSLLFIPKFYYLYCDPNGENLGSTCNYEEKLSSLEDQINQLETELRTLKKTRKTIRQASQSNFILVGNDTLPPCNKNGIAEHVKSTDVSTEMGFESAVEDNVCQRIDDDFDRENTIASLRITSQSERLEPAAGLVIEKDETLSLTTQESVFLAQASPVTGRS